MMGVLAPFDKPLNGMLLAAAELPGTGSHGDRATLVSEAQIACASASRACRLVERCAQSPRQLQRVVMRPEMHENQPRLFGQHVTVDRRDLDAMLTQCLDDRVHFLAGKDEITGNRRLAVAGWLEVDRRRHPH